MRKENITRYRGVYPATIVSVLEGDGDRYPYDEVDYVVVHNPVMGNSKTLGKVVPLTEEEKKGFKQIRV